MAAKLTLTLEARVLDLGAGYGGAARYLAREFGGRVDCLILSEVQNHRNRIMNAARMDPPPDGPANPDGHLDLTST